MVLFLGWFYFWGGLISGVALFLGWPYFWGGLISGVVLFLGWPYFWGGLISGVVLFLGSCTDVLYQLYSTSGVALCIAHKTSKLEDTIVIG